MRNRGCPTKSAAEIATNRMEKRAHTRGQRKADSADPPPRGIKEREECVIATAIEHLEQGRTLGPDLTRVIHGAPASLSVEPLQAIASAIKARLRRGDPVHLQALIDDLGDRGEWVSELIFPLSGANRAAPLPAAEYEARIVLQEWRRRRLLDTAQNMIAAAEEGPEAIDAALRVAYETLPDLEVDPPPPPARRTPQPIGTIARPVVGADDPDELIQHRFLCRGGGMLVAAPTGIGKSTFALQCALSFAVARECLGLVPARPLRSLYIQAENDAGDLAELRDGILRGLDFSQSEREAALANVHCLTIDDLCGQEFLLRGVAPLLEPGRWDLLWIDPLLAYLGGDVSRQEVVSPWLRNGLNPLIHRAGCGCVIVHHSNKPQTGQEKGTWQAGDYAYLGAGSADISNWARAVVAIRSVGSHEVFELRLGKRGRRAGWKDANGALTYARHIAHGTDAIYWRNAEPHEVPGKPGRPGAYTVQDVVGLLDGQEMTTSEWQDLAETELGVSRRSFYRLKRDAAVSGAALQSKLSGKWMKGR